MRRHHIVCGGLPCARASNGQVVQLDINGQPGSSGKVNLRISDICSRLSQQLPPILVDLIEIAAYVYCADQYVTRGTERMRGMGADWRRDFTFQIPVRRLDTWRSEAVLSALIDVLCFLSEDDYRFEFVPSVNPPHVGDYFDFADGRRGFQADEVMLFSGGLDSFAGALDEIIGQGKRVVLVSHESSSFVRSKQGTLVDALRRRSARGRLLHVPVAVNKNREEGPEYTQRSRSFLFASLAFVVATMFGRKRLRFYENGIVSLNLPIVEHVVGARATRTTHPRVLAGFGRLFSILSGTPITIENPFFWKTKKEVVEVIARHGCQELIADTFSCAKVREATQMQKHCGVCSQCIDRRFGILAAGLELHEPAAAYAVDLLTGERQPGHDIVMAEGFVMAAQRIAKMSEYAFQTAYGQIFRALRHLPGSPDDGARAIYDLHRRHADAVNAVITRGIAELAPRLADLSLPETCLASLIIAPVARQPVVAEADGAEAQPSRQPCGEPARSPIVFAIDDEERTIVFTCGTRIIGSASELIYMLAVRYREDLTNRKPKEKYQYIPTARLVDQLGIDDPTLRQQVYRCRAWLSRNLKATLGRIPGPNEVIDNKKWKGYRLNPHMVLDDRVLVPGLKTIERHGPLFRQAEPPCPAPARDPSTAVSRP